MLNGCLCCVLTGQVSDALKELRDLYNPDRILVETSGSAFPAPLALQIREMEGDGFKLDGIVNVLDCANFKGYEDTSYTAKVQCRFTDLLLLTKWEAVTERQLDTVLDSVYTLYDGTVVPVPPIIKVSKTGGLCPDVVFGLDTALFSELEAGEDGVMVDSEHHAREVDIIQVIRNLSGKMERKECGVEGCDARGVRSHQHEHHGHSHHHEEHGHDARAAEPDLNPLDRASFDAWLGTLSKDDVYRVKGLVRFDTGLEILNWAFGNWEYTKVPATEKWDDVISRITVMGRGLKMHLPGVRDGFKAGEGECWLVPAEVQ
jgi:G3E family GTPase